jgi:hypothetical protein
MLLNLATLFTVIGTTNKASLPADSIKTKVQEWLTSVGVSNPNVEIDYFPLGDDYYRRRLSSNFVQQYDNDLRNPGRRLLSTPTKAPTSSPTKYAHLAAHVSLRLNGAAAVGAAITALSASTVSTDSLATDVSSVLTAPIEAKGKAVSITVEQSDFVPTNAPTQAPTEAPTEAPSPMPTPYPTKSPSKQPTEWPTFAPTGAATNPSKPDFTASEFAKFLTADADVADATSLTAPPSPKPTPHPTNAGYVIIAKQVNTHVMSVPFSFALSATEARNPFVQEILAGGIAAALGLDIKMVKITATGGMPVRRLGSRKLAVTSITTEIESASGLVDDKAKLKASITEAATEGSIVANIQKIASDKGALTASLRDMPRALVAPEITEKVVIRTKMEQVRPNTPAPTGRTPSPTDSPTKAPTTGTPTEAPTGAPTVALPVRFEAKYQDGFMTIEQKFAVLVCSIIIGTAILAKIYCICTKEVSDMTKLTQSQIERPAVTSSQLEHQLDATEVSTADV